MSWQWPGDGRRPDEGAQWIYRSRLDGQSERVKIAAIHENKRSYRVEIVFCDGDTAGTSEIVPSSRLHGPWQDVTAYDDHMAGWRRLDTFELTDTEHSAIDTAFDLLVDNDIADYMWSPVRYVTTVADADGLERLTGLPLAELTQRFGTFELHGTTMLSPEATILIAEYACRKNPMPILNAVIEEEKRLREKSKHGDRSGKHPTSPEYEYEWYRKYHRPIHELLRQWCGQRATSLQERVTAAEAENIRLEALVNRLIDALADEGNLTLAHVLARELHDDRITPESIRPVIDRPLHPSEIPVRYVTRSRRWS